MAASIATRMPVDSEERFLTLTVVIGLSSLLTGAMF